MAYTSTSIDRRGLTLEKLQHALSYLGRIKEDRTPFLWFSYLCPESAIFEGEMVDKALEQKFPDFNRKRHKGFMVPRDFEILLRSKVEFSGCPMKSS